MLETGRQIASELTLTIIGDTDVGPVSDIAAAVDQSAGGTVRVLPVLGAGGLRNLSDIMFLRGVDAAIVLASSLDELKRRDPQLSELAGSRLRYLLRLYNAELHVVARRDRVTSLADLAGQRVNFLAADGSADIVGHHVLAALGIEVVPVHVDFARGLQQVIDGDIAATMVFAGAPLGDLQQLPAGTPLHLVPVDGGFDRMDRSYLPALLEHHDYPNLISRQEDAVVTLAGPLLLAAYDWPLRPERQQKLQRFLEALAAGLGDGADQGRHAKWRDVNLAAEMPGWQRDGASVAWLTQRPAAAHDGQPEVSSGAGSKAGAAVDSLGSEGLGFVAPQ